MLMVRKNQTIVKITSVICNSLNNEGIKIVLKEKTKLFEDESHSKACEGAGKTRPGRETILSHCYIIFTFPVILFMPFRCIRKNQIFEDESH